MGPLASGAGGAIARGPGVCGLVRAVESGCVQVAVLEWRNGSGSINENVSSLRFFIYNLK